MSKDDAVLDAVLGRLLDERNAAGVWEGELSSSALSTATAVIALALSARERARTDSEGLAERGAQWLSRNQNADGGWGDTIDSPSNVSTTTLCWVALGIDAALAGGHRATLKRADGFLEAEVGALTPEGFAGAIGRAYGEDRTFAAPILMAGALGGRFGPGREAWSELPRLPFELAALPRGAFRRLGLPVVSYALPALIAVGQVIHHRCPTSNPLARALRNLSRARTLDVLTSIQPSTGGFLEATPLTSFVVMALVGCGHGRHAVVQEGLRFLRGAVRADGSWPIDTNLSTWVTTLAVNALAGGGRLEQLLDEGERTRIRDWLTGQQYQKVHAYTGAAAGGWAWTDLAGGVPDADDTAGALLALEHLGAEPRPTRMGARWLAGLQNRDGGIPTFCRGWGKLPFDRSCPDITAHALRAWDGPEPSKPFERRSRRAVRYLVDSQQADGSWVPLWFGNQQAEALENRLVGTSRVLRACAALENTPLPGSERAIERAVDWMLAAQAKDGGWGACAGVAATIEETALAVEALASERLARRGGAALADAVALGRDWLTCGTQRGARFEASPIGLYFAKLWYSERLYPLIFTAAALERARRFFRGQPAAGLG